MELSTVTHELHRGSDHVPSRHVPPAAHVSPDLARPLQRYAIISELGGGGMSTVHLAHDHATGHVVAVKRVAEHAASVPGAMRRFAREASIVAQLRHPNIVEMVAIEREGQAPVAIVTEYVGGVSLREMLQEARREIRQEVQQGPALAAGPPAALPIDRVVRVLRDVASALAYTHARNIVHRDVKPANILIESDTGRALLADFGIACESGERADVEDGLTIGTPAYMAPEQIEGRLVDARADLYALCVVGWEMLAGRMPWAGAQLADVLHRQCYEPLPDLALLRPDIPVYLLRAINGGLAKEPAMRWRDGAELLRQLSPTPAPLDMLRHAPAPADATVYVETRAIQPPGREPPEGGAPAAATPIRRRRVRVLTTTLGTVAVALALGGLAPHLSHRSTAPRPGIDPELDSMLTLAVVSPLPATPASRRPASPPVCRASVQVAHCAAISRRPAPRTRVHRRSR